MTSFKGANSPTKGAIFLDNAGFFRHYLRMPLRPHAMVSETTLPLMLVESARAIPYLYNDMIPWLARRLATTPIALSTVRVCIEEIFFITSKIIQELEKGGRSTFPNIRKFYSYF
ncbi:MAG: hypothetical protein IPI14_13445 [Polaromonas sp.]|nr:hypothetical protein [Polaromonas sp.]